MSEDSIKIGLELHVYLRCDTKLFCNCPVDFDAEPNTTTCPVCTGQPGSKPMLPNKDALHHALTVALMLGCTVNKSLLFQRKHYSWPDLPNGYQKTMSGDYAGPVGVNGSFKGIGITQCHLEEDPARWNPVEGTVDYNRSGYPLLEIVTDPDFTDVNQLKEWLEDFVVALNYAGAVHEQAGVKGDVNVSVSPNFIRAEIKNINSFSAVVEGAAYEVERQRKAIAAGETLTQQTRTWDDEQKVTHFMRDKENAQDYRFIPEPDLPIVEVSQQWVDDISADLPAMPWEREQALVDSGVGADDAHVLTRDVGLITYFDQLTSIDSVLVARWLRREVTRVANYHHKPVSHMHIHVDDLRALLEDVRDKKITEQVGQKIMEKLGNHALEHPDSLFDVREHIDKEGLGAVGSSDELEKIALDVIAAQQKAVDDYKAGNEKSLHFLVGQVMRQTRGAAAPDVVRAVFEKLLK